MAFFIEDVDSDNGSIHDVLQCWGSSEDDGDVDSIDGIPRLDDDLDADVPMLSKDTCTPVSSKSNDDTLTSLMAKYPNFIPERLPGPSKKRSRPLCMFVNYMGRRNPTPAAPQPKAAASVAVVREASPYPTDVPTHHPSAAKRPRIASAIPVVTPSSTKTTVKPAGVSHQPTLGPTSASGRISTHMKA